jgi:hypothetical protein
VAHLLREQRHDWLSVTAWRNVRTRCRKGSLL